VKRADKQTVRLKLTPNLVSIQETNVGLVTILSMKNTGLIKNLMVNQMNQIKKIYPMERQLNNKTLFQQEARNKALDQRL